MIGLPRRWLLALALSALVAGCDDHGYDHLELEVTTAASPRAEVTPARISLPVGSALGIEARAYEEDGDRVEGTLVLQSDSPDLLGLTPGPDEGSFVLFGRAVGQARVRVLIDGSQVDTIEVVVTPQGD